MTMTGQVLLGGSALLAAVSFAVLCIFLIRTLSSARQTLDSLKTTIEGASDKVESIRGKVEELTTNVNEISVNVKEKLHAADSLFEAARDAGTTIQETAHTAKELTDRLTRVVQEQTKEKEHTWKEWLQIGLRVAGAVRSSVASAKRRTSGQEA
ncbi:DUF948 domain-containing protein [Cohnella fermenti]|nr:DUF948 domain-containing protein [Cohnella fermenti]